MQVAGVLLEWAGAAARAGVPAGAAVGAERKNSWQLAEKWTDDRERCRKAGIDDEVAFATKPELAWRMIGRAREAGVPLLVTSPVTLPELVAVAGARWVVIEDCFAEAKGEAERDRCRRLWRSRRAAVRARLRWCAASVS